MRLTRLAIDRPFLTSLLTAVLLLCGLWGGSRLPVDLNPKAELATLTVTCIFPGAGPTTVETLIARPLEQCLKGVPLLKHVYTVSQESVCIGFIEFEIGSDSEAAQARTREALAAARSRFPEAMAEPVLAKLDINAQPVLFLGLVNKPGGQRPPEELRRLAEDVLEPRLRNVAGVTAVEVLGGRKPEVAVAVDRSRLLANGLTLGRLQELLEASNQSVPAGPLEANGKQLGVRLVGRFKSLDDLRGVPIPPADDPGKLLEQALRPQPAHPAGRALRLRDVATVSSKAVDTDISVRLQQRPAVGLIVTKRGDGNTIAIARQAAAAAKAAPLPADVEVLVAKDSARTVADALADVSSSLVMSIILCSVAMLLFLRNALATLIVCCTIPVCLLGALAPMAWGGHTINQMTLLGLAISIGILVDDSIVCIEAITHRLQQGEPASEAAFNGRNDIALADTSTTLLDVAVYGPIAVMAGVVGQFFRDFGFVVSVSAALSLLAAYTIVPAMAAHCYRDRPPTGSDWESRPLFAALQSRYLTVLQWALDHPWRAIGLGWLTLGVAGRLAYQHLGTDFIPAADLSTVVVNLELPAGTSASTTEHIVAETEALVAKEPDLEALFTTLGRIEVGFGVVSRQGPAYAQINVTLKDKRGVLDRLLGRHGLRERSDDAVAASIRRRLKAIPAVRFQVIAAHGWGGAGAPIDFSLYGKDLGQMARAGAEVMEALRTTPGLVNPDLAWRLGEPEVQVTLDRERAREHYIYPGAVARELRAGLAGAEAGNLEVGERIVPIKLRLADFDRRSASDVARLPVGRSGSRLLTVADVATVTQGTGPTRIDRRDGLRDLNFKAYLLPGVTLGEAQQRIEAALRQVGVPLEGPAKAGTPPTKARYPQLRWGWRGDAATLDESSAYMLGTALTGLALAYLVMAVLFNSAIHPFTILLSVPMAGTGGLLLLVLWGSSLNIVSGIGFILLIGIVVRNAILLLDYTLQLRAQGVPRREALEQAGRRRLRPILMTTFTTTVGMLPVALAIGKGAEIRSPMAIAVIGGLLLSTVLTLVIIPVTYMVLDDWLGEGRQE